MSSSSEHRRAALGRDVRECERGLVGPSKLRPCSRGRLELADEFEPVGSLCRQRVRRLLDAGTFAPRLQAGDVVLGPDTHREGQRLFGRFAGGRGIPGEPGRFRRRYGNRCDPRQLTRGLREGTRLHEEREDVRVTAPGTGTRDDRERERAWERRDPAAAEDELGGLDRVRPTSLVELEAGAVGEQVELV